MVVQAEVERPISQHLHVHVKGQDHARMRRRVPPTDSLRKVKLTRFDGTRGDREGAVAHPEGRTTWQKRKHRGEAALS